jgi:hypothetical protein
MATGRLDDAEAVERFVAGTPGAESLRARLVCGRCDWLDQYDAPTWAAR